MANDASKRINIKIKSRSRGDQDFVVRAGLGLQGVCAQEKTPIEYDCRKADCGICIIRILSGLENLSPLTDSERDFLKAMHASPDERLACQVRIFGDLALEVEEL